MSESSETVGFEVESGEGTDSIGAKLKEKGLIEDELIFKLYLKKEGRGEEIQAGTFGIPKKATIPEIVDILSNAIKLDVVRVTIIEGYRLAQIGDVAVKAFEGKEGVVFDLNEFNTITRSPDSRTFASDVQEFLNAYKPAGKNLEGFLYPDTYDFENTAPTKFVVEALVRQLIKKTADLNIGADFYDKLILASIIEKESFTNDEKDEISSVFTNRLEIDMALESDTTVNYITGKNDPRITQADRQIDSPYNTYKYPGLTPTPICSPRIESIQAAMNPASTDYFYFIHEQDGIGQVHFAETLQEHNANISEYLD